MAPGKWGAMELRGQARAEMEFRHEEKTSVSAQGEVEGRDA